MCLWRLRPKLRAWETKKKDGRKEASFFNLNVPPCLYKSFLTRYDQCMHTFPQLSIPFIFNSRFPSVFSPSSYLLSALLIFDTVFAITRTPTHRLPYVATHFTFPLFR